MDLIVETANIVIDYKKDVLMNKTKHHIIQMFREKCQNGQNEHLKLINENEKLKLELNELNKKFNIQTSLENSLATVEVDLNTPPVNSNLNIPHDPVIMYNHTLACKVEEENNKKTLKIEQLKNKIKWYKITHKKSDKMIEDLSEELCIYKSGCKNCISAEQKINIMKNDYETLYHSVKNSTATKYNELLVTYNKMKESYDDMASRQVNIETKNIKLTKHMNKLERQCSKIRELTYSIQVLESVFDTTD